MSSNSKTLITIILLGILTFFSTFIMAKTITVDADKNCRFTLDDQSNLDVKHIQCRNVEGKLNISFIADTAKGIKINRLITADTSINEGGTLRFPQDFSRSVTQLYQCGSCISGWPYKKGPGILYVNPLPPFIVICSPC